MIREIAQAFGEHILSSGIHHTVAVKESQAKGVPLLEHSPKSRAAMDYLMLAQEVIGKAFLSDAVLMEPTLPDMTGEGPLKDFTFRSRDARVVHLVGDFNQWTLSNDSLLWQKEEGVWQKRIYLGPGCHRYKFVVDGQWVTDPENDRIEPNPYGGMDSVLDLQ